MMKKGLVRDSKKQWLVERSCINLSYLDFVFPRTKFVVIVLSWLFIHFLYYFKYFFFQFFFRSRVFNSRVRFSELDDCLPPVKNKDVLSCSALMYWGGLFGLLNGSVCGVRALSLTRPWEHFVPNWGFNRWLI